MRIICIAVCVVLAFAKSAGTAQSIDGPVPLARLELTPVVGTTTPDGPEFSLHVSIHYMGQKDLVIGKDLSWVTNDFAHLGLGLRHKSGEGMSIQEMTAYGTRWPDWYYWTRIAAGKSYGTDFTLDRAAYPDLYKPGEYLVVVTYTQQKWIAPAVNINFPPIFTAPALQLTSNEATIVTKGRPPGED